MSRFSKRTRLVAIVVATLVFAACGGSDSSDEPAVQNPAANQMQAIVASFDITTGGPRRFLLGLATGDGRLIGFGSIQVRFSLINGATGASQEGAFLPIPTTQVPDPLPTQPTVVDAVRGRGVYATEATFDQPGLWNAEVDADVEGLGRQQALTTFQVNTKHEAIAVGDKAPATENYTIDDHGNAPLSAVDSRAQGSKPVPDPELHEKTIASSLAAKRPFVISFSTPVYCQSRFCGPITNMVADVAAEYSDKADFIHVEIYRDFESRRVNDAALEWLQLIPGGDVHEPWTYVVDKTGMVTARFDNVTTRDELLAALNDVT
jgi:hypothetical protein